MSVTIVLRDRNNNVYGDKDDYTLKIDGHQDIDFLCEAVKKSCDLMTFRSSDFQLYCCVDQRTDEWKNIYDLGDVRLIQDLEHYIMIPNASNPIKVVLPLSIVRIWYRLVNEDLTPYHYTKGTSLKTMESKTIEDVCIMIKKSSEHILKGISSDELNIFYGKTLLKRDATLESIAVDYNIPFPNPRNHLLVVVSYKGFMSWFI